MSLSAGSTRPVSFTDLFVWRKGHELVLAIYGLTREFPKLEDFGLKTQLQRAAVSITSNIAEGFERKSGQELEQFLCVSRASLAEAQNQLLIARDLRYIDDTSFSKIAGQTTELHKLLNAFIKSVKARNLKTKDLKTSRLNGK